MKKGRGLRRAPPFLDASLSVLFDQKPIPPAKSGKPDFAI